MNLRTIWFLTQVFGRTIFSLGVLALFLLVVGILARANWLIDVSAWAGLLLWIAWFSLVLIGTLIRRRNH